MKSEPTGGPDPTAPAPSGRRWGRLAVRIGGTIVILSALIALISPRQIVMAVSRLTPELLLPAIAIYLLLHLLGTVKWQMMINAAGAGLGFGHAARCYYAGLFSNTFLVSLVGGDVVRAGMALRQARSKAGLVLGSLVDRLFDVVGLLAITLAGALLMPGLGDSQSRVLYRGLLVGAGMLAAVGAVLVLVLSLRRLPFKVRRRLVRLRVAARAVLQERRRVVLAVMIGIVVQTSLVLLNAWLGVACGLHLPLWAWLFAWPLAKIVSMLPVSLGGLGVREAAFLSLLLPLGADAAAVVAASLAFQAVIIAGGLAGGVISLLLSTGRPRRLSWAGIASAGRARERSAVPET